MSDPRVLKHPVPVVGLSLMAVAMLLIPFVDGIAKFLTYTHSPLYISWARYAVASLIVLPLAFSIYGRHLFPARNLGAHFSRTVFLMAAMTLYFVAISKVQMATAITAYFIGPIVAVVLTVVFLKERLNARKVGALLLGFSGAIIILKPGGELEPGVLFAMASGICFAVYLVATRQASRNNDPMKTLSFQCFVGTVILTPQALWAWSIPQLSELYLFLGIGLLSAFSHILSILAFRHAEASLLAPLVYLELIGTSAVGYFYFNEAPDFTLWIGASVIVAGGLLLVKQIRL